MFDWTILDIERNFSFVDYYQTIHENYWKLVLFPTIFIYLITIYSLSKWMTTRPSFSLRKVLFYWNLSLAIFSIIGSIRTVPELLETLTVRGLHHSICHDPVMNGPYGLWVILFIWSKIVELGDTIFIVLRKQPLIFLHWYHHVTVLFCVFFTINYPLSTLRYYVTTNYFVHSIMYSYYASRAKGLKVPKFISMVITTLQLSQMVIAFSITSYAMIEKLNVRHCNVDFVNITLGIVCYGSYFALFAEFFVKNYLRKDDVKKSKSNATSHTFTNGHSTNTSMKKKTAEVFDPNENVLLYSTTINKHD